MTTELHARISRAVKVSNPDVLEDLVAQYETARLAGRDYVTLTSGRYTATLKVLHV